MSTWLRVSRFVENESPMTMVTEKGYLRRDIHVIANATRENFGKKADVEIFQYDGNLEEALFEGARRAQVRIERAKHLRDTLHDFLISMFIVQKPSTIIMPAHRAPIASPDLRAILLSVALHPSYQGHTVLLQPHDGNRVSLEKGTVIVKEPS